MRENLALERDILEQKRKDILNEVEQKRAINSINRNSMK